MKLRFKKTDRMRYHLSDLGMFKDGTVKEVPNKDVCFQLLRDYPNNFEVFQPEVKEEIKKVVKEDKMKDKMIKEDKPKAQVRKSSRRSLSTDLKGQSFENMKKEESR